MPVIDKLPALLRQDLESAFEDDLDNVFDITNLRHSLDQQKREVEIEMKRVYFSFSSFHFPPLLSLPYKINHEIFRVCRLRG